MDNFNTPDLEQAPDSYLKPGETLEDFDVEFRRPNADGGVQQLVQPNADGSRPGYSGPERGTGKNADIYAATTLAKKRLEAEKKGLVYDTETKKFRKKKERGPNKNPNPLKGKLIDTNPGQEFLDIAEKVYSKDFENKKGLALWEAIGRNKRASIKSGSVTGEKTGVNLATSIPEGKISQAELLELLKESTGKEFKRSIISDIRPGKKNYIANKVRELLNIKSSPFKSGKGTFYYFDKPTPEQLEFIGNYIESPHLMDRTVRNMKLMEENFGKLLAKSTKKDAVKFFTNEMTIDKVKEMFIDNGVKDITDSKAALALTRYAQSLQGKLFKNVDGIPENSKVGDFIFQAFNSLDKYHPWKQGSYQAVLDDINANMGKKAGNLAAFKTKFREKMQTLYPGRGFDFNEVFSITTSANRGSYPYAYFVDLTSNAMNKGALSTYQGKASIAEGKIQKALINFKRTGNKKFYNEAVRVKDVFNNSTRKLFLSSEKVLQYQKDYGIKPNALKIEVGSQKQVADKINFASDYFSNKNLQKWKNLGIDIDAHSGRTGYVKTFGGKGVPSNVITAGELFTEDTRLGKKTKVFDEDALKKFLNKNLALLGCPKGYQAATGGRVPFGNGTSCPAKGRKIIENGLKNGFKNKNQQVLAEGILKSGRFLKDAVSLRGLFGPAALAFTVAAEAGIVGYDMLSTGKSFKEAIGNSLFNYALGDKTKIDSDEEFMKRLKNITVGPQGYQRMSDEQIGKMLNFKANLDDMYKGFDLYNQLKDLEGVQEIRDEKGNIIVKGKAGKILDNQTNQAIDSEFFSDNAFNLDAQRDKIQADIQDYNRTNTPNRITNYMLSPKAEEGAKAAEYANLLVKQDQLKDAGTADFLPKVDQGIARNLKQTKYDIENIFKKPDPFRQQFMSLPKGEQSMIMSYGYPRYMEGGIASLNVNKK
jgi:hypothetical protein